MSKGKNLTRVKAKLHLKFTKSTDEPKICSQINLESKNRPKMFDR